MDRTRQRITWGLLLLILIYTATGYHPYCVHSHFESNCSQKEHHHSKTDLNSFCLPVQLVFCHSVLQIDQHSVHRGVCFCDEHRHCSHSCRGLLFTVADSGSNGEPDLDNQGKPIKIYEILSNGTPSFAVFPFFSSFEKIIQFLTRTGEVRLHLLLNIILD